MIEPTRKKGLGRGLAALIDGSTVEPKGADGGGPFEEIAIDLIQPNPDQPRRRFLEDELETLAASIRQKGVIQPLVVRPSRTAPGCFEIVAGERRWRAAQRAQLHVVPALVRALDDGESLEIALLENVQRSDLNPVEEAAGYAQLIERYGHTQDQISTVIGKSRSHIANTLRLLNLPEDVLELLRSGRLTAGHARAALSVADPSAFAREAVAKGWSVRETERQAKRRAASRNPARAEAPPTKDADTAALEADLSAVLKMKVNISHRSNGGGEVKLVYRDISQLDELCKLLGDL